MEKIKYKIELIENFQRYRITINNIQQDDKINISAIVYLKSEKEYIFMENVTSNSGMVTYPEKSINYITKIGDGEYQFFFYPDNEKQITLRILASINDVLLDKKFRL